MVEAEMREVEVEISHVFPIIPLLTIFGAAGVANLPFRRQAKVTVILVLLLSHAASTLHAFPNYVSYVNELWGGPGDAYRYLADSNVDWGQAQKMVRDYLATILNESNLHLAFLLVLLTSQSWITAFHACRSRTLSTTFPLSHSPA